MFVSPILVTHALNRNIKIYKQLLLVRPKTPTGKKEKEKKFHIAKLFTLHTNAKKLMQEQHHARASLIKEGPNEIPL